MNRHLKSILRALRLIPCEHQYADVPDETMTSMDEYMVTKYYPCSRCNCYQVKNWHTEKGRELQGYINQNRQQRGEEPMEMYPLIN